MNFQSNTLPFDTGLAANDNLHSNSSTVALAHSYHARGWTPVPVRPREKCPIPSEWQKRTLNTPLDDFEEWQNVGIVLGSASNDLVDVDKDNPGALRAAPYLLPETGLTFGRKGKANSHSLYIVPDCGQTKQFKSHHTGMIVEYRANGAQSVFPGSIHKSGERIEFSSSGEPKVISRDELLGHVSALAACSLVATRWKPGIRHEASLAFAGWLLREEVSPDRIRTLMRAICAAANDPETDNRLASIVTTAEKLNRSEPTTGFPELVKLLGEEAVNQVAEWLGVGGERKYERTRDDGDWGQRLTDDANGQRFADQHRHEAVYCCDTEEWFVWDGRRWKADKDRRVEVMATDTARSIYAEASTEFDQGRRRLLSKFSEKSLNESGVRDMLSASRRYMSCPLSQFDTDPWLLNFRNGTLDLRTGSLSPHDSANRITKLVEHDYLPDAPCPIFEKFINQIMKVDPLKIAFLQRAIGYSLLGDNPEQCFFVVCGSGSNGKSTLFTLLQNLIGGYAQSVPVSTLTAKDRDFSGAPRSDIVRMRGVRFGVSFETEKQVRLSEPLMKQLTGGDVITARELYRSEIEFKPVAKIWLYTNFKPKLSGDDPAIWRRVHLIPFDYTVSDQDRDKSLPEKLMAEAPGILAWVIQGFLEWQCQGGLNPPECIRTATREYRDENNGVAQFVEDCLERDSSATVAKNQMHAAYRRWAEQNGGESLDIKNLRNRLVSLGFEDSKSGSRRFWRNVRLINDDSILGQMGQ
jgi:putative DNA primase/helicase